MNVMGWDGMGFDLLSSELCDDEKPIESVTKAEVGDGHGDG